MSQKQTGPLQSLFVDIKKIISSMVTKDNAEASKYESQQIAASAELFKAATLKDDTYMTYKNWWTKEMFREVNYSITTTQFKYFYANPYNVPLKYRDNLREKGRAAFLSSYEEQNTYYRMLIGLPAINDTDYIYPSEELQEKWGVGNTPVHELSTYLQNRYIVTDEYETVVANNPDKKYLKFLGSNKVDLYTARSAKDFDIIRYPINRPDINPYLINAFAKQYGDAREYIVVTLYNSQLEDLYEGYRSFMGFLIFAYTIMHLCNSAVESVTTHKYLDDTIIYIILSLYGVPDTLYLTNDVRRKLAIHIMKLVKEKATDEVYYDLIKILGYQDVVISKLILMKGQKFGENGEALNEYEPYFLQLDLKDQHAYDTISHGNAPTYSYEEITNDDPYWWHDEEVENILQTRNYSESDSKYIVIEGIIRQTKSLFESIYFSRMIIDNPNIDEFMINIPSILGTTPVSIYDCMVFLICATCMNNGLSGEIYTENEKLLATAGFNFEIDMDEFMEFIDNSNYLDKLRLKSYLNNISILEKSDITRMYSDVIYPLREWIESKMCVSVNRKEFLEYEMVYKALFTYDLSRNKILDSFEMPMEIIQKKYNISDSDLNALKAFYPHDVNGAITVENFNEHTNNTRYHYPFLSLTNLVDWYVHIIIEVNGRQYDRGYLYLYDILNSTDVRTIKNSDGDLIFMDYEDEEEGWVINQKVVDRAIYLINHLEEDDLRYAFFQIYTTGSSGDIYEAGQKLPSSMRTNIFKSILIDKLTMDCNGLAAPPTSYFEYLYRKNRTLYDVLCDPEADRFNKNKTAWMNDVISVITTLESELSIHVKYLEESVIGKDLYFKPLITLIKHFKSLLVEIAKTNLKYVFDDKIDAGGNSNMLKLFDSFRLVIHFMTMSASGYEANLGLYDTIHATNRHLYMLDRSEVYTAACVDDNRSALMGSVYMVDEAKFFKNGKPIDSIPKDVYEHSEFYLSGKDLMIEYDESYGIPELRIDEDGYLVLYHSDQKIDDDLLIQFRIENGNLILIGGEGSASTRDEGSMWYTGEPGSGLWSEEDDVLMRIRTRNRRVKNNPVDLDYWKELVPSYHKEE